jgi:hypothetical protein
MSNNKNANQPGQNNQAEMTREEIEKTLREEERYQTYFKGFAGFSVESFIKDYAFKKWMWWQYGDQYLKAQENADEYLIDDASKHLAIIQQKKLFDVQCQWRAEKIELAAIEICFDFEAWQHNVMHCPFIEPVTRHDIELYQQYLSTTYVEFDDDFFYFGDWQNYNGLKKTYNDVENSTVNFPEWYAYHNLHTGANVLMLLPNIRGSKEAFYEEKDREARADIIKQQAEKSQTRSDNRPHIATYDIDKLEAFIEACEDKQTKIYYRASKQQNRNNDEEEELHNIIDYLLDQDKPVAIEGHNDFREALRLAKNRMKANKLMEFLPYAFEEYQIARSMGFGPSDDVVKNFNWYIDDLKPSYMKRILNGRKACGEPENLDF